MGEDDSNLDVPRRGGGVTLPPTNSDKEGGEIL